MSARKVGVNASGALNTPIMSERLKFSVARAERNMPSNRRENERRIVCSWRIGFLPMSLGNMKAKMIGEGSARMVKTRKARGDEEWLKRASGIRARKWIAVRSTEGTKRLRSIGWKSKSFSCCFKVPLDTLSFCFDVFFVGGFDFEARLGTRQPLRSQRKMLMIVKLPAMSIALGR